MKHFRKNNDTPRFDRFKSLLLPVKVDTKVIKDANDSTMETESTRDPLVDFLHNLSEKSPDNDELFDLPSGIE